MAAAHGGSAWRPHGGLSPPACAVPCLSLRVYESSLRLYSGTGGGGGGGQTRTRRISRVRPKTRKRRIPAGWRKKREEDIPPRCFSCFRTVPKTSIVSESRLRCVYESYSSTFTFFFHAHLECPRVMSSRPKQAVANPQNSPPYFPYIARGQIWKNLNFGTR